MNKPVEWMNESNWMGGIELDVITDEFKQSSKGGDCSEYHIPLYTHPVKELHLSLQKEKETGELLAVTYTDDEHRIVEVLWQRPPVKELTPCEELRAFQEQQNGVFSEHNACCYRHECRIVWNDWEEIKSNPAELTDEKIEEIAEYYGVEDIGICDFVRAILRKAKEK